MKLHKLIKRYESDPISGFHKLRYHVRVNYRNLLRQVDERYGRTKLSKIKPRTILDWHAAWLDGTKVAAAHAFVKRMRTLFGFGVTALDDRQCSRLRLAMSAMRFPAPQARTQRLTAKQVDAIRRAAHRKRWPSIALAEAVQFELMLRQKDVVGEWVPEDEAGRSDIVHRGQKWLRGIRWDEIDGCLVLGHVTSKKQKPIKVDLRLAPMVMDELRRIKRPASGPLIVDEHTGRPYANGEFRRRWRIVADAAGIPANVFNMDSRAGGISEAFEADASPDEIREAATHSDLAMTQRYNRGDFLAKASDVMRRRVEHRAQL